MNDTYKYWTRLLARGSVGRGRVCVCVRLLCLRRCFSCWKALICFSDFCSAKEQTAWFDPCRAVPVHKCICMVDKVSWWGEEWWIQLLINRSKKLHLPTSFSPVRNHCPAPPGRLPFSLSLSVLMKAPVVRTATLMFPVNARTHTQSLTITCSLHLWTNHRNH